MAVVSTKILVTHPGFSGTGSNFFGVIDISNPAAPAWSSANLATNALTGVPTSVANFNNRAYFSVGNTLQFSDVLVPTTRSNASQALTVGDTTAITAQSGLPFQTTSGGVVGALVVFKQSQIWQVTGDPTTSNLALTVCISVVMALPDYPYSKITNKELCNIPIYGAEDMYHVHFSEVMMGTAPREVNGKVVDLPGPVTAGDYVLVATGEGETITGARRSVYSGLKKIKIPNSPFYRTDIGAGRLKKQLPELQRLGYLKGLSD
jgi:hypothetical protein